MTELGGHLRTLRRRAAFIGLSVAAVLIVAGASTPRASVYRADALVYIGARQAVDAAGQVRTDPMIAAAQLTRTFAVMIDSVPIARSAVAKTGLPRSPGAVVGATSAAVEPNTQLLRVTVTDPSRAVARDLANAMAQAFVETLRGYEPAPSQSSGPALVASVVVPAVLPGHPLPSDLADNLVSAGIFGLLASVGAALLFEWIDVTLRDASEAGARLELPVLGNVPLLSSTGRPGIGWMHPGGPS